MCWTCAIVKLENPQKEFRTQFESETRRWGFPFVRLLDEKGHYIYFFMNISQEDAKHISGAFKTNDFIFLQQKDFENFNVANLGITASLAELSAQFFQQFPWKSPEQLNKEVRVYLEQSQNYPGSQRWRYRCRMYHKPQSWELETGLRNQYYEMWKKDN